MKKIFTILAISALAFSAQAQTTFSYVLNNQGFTNSQELSTGNIVAGKLTYEALQNASANSPKFFTAGGGTVRLYSDTAGGDGNSYAIKAVGSVKMSSVKIKTTGMLGADNYAPSTAIVTADGAVLPTVYDPADPTATYLIVPATAASTIKIKNGQTGTSAQIRIISIEITYTDGLAVSDVSGIKVALVKNSNVGNTIVFGAKANVQIIAANGQVVKTAAVSENSKLDVSALPKGVYIISADVNGQQVSQKIIKN